MRTMRLIFWSLMFGIIVFPILLGLKKKSTAKAKNIYTTQTEAEIWATNKLQQMSLDQKIGQFFMVSSQANNEQSNINKTLNLIKNHHVGGVVFFEGDKTGLKKAIEIYASSSKIPLLMAIDAEWGLDMRLNDGTRYAYPYTLGAANQTSLTEKTGALMAMDLKEVGIHMNLGTIADVNQDNENPVIGFRSFGSYAPTVALHVKASVKGQQENGILSCLKHFPGHGNTNQDSHDVVPQLKQSSESFRSTDFLPFKSGIEAGADAVMIGHLNAKSLDDSDLPATFSSKIIKQILQNQLGFRGLVVSDALNMMSIRSKYETKEIPLKAFEAGCDILLNADQVAESIETIKRKVGQGQITTSEIDARVLKILKIKHRYIVAKTETKQFTKGEVEWHLNDCAEKAITVLKNESKLLPIGLLNKKIVNISIGEHTAYERDALNSFADVAHFQFNSVKEALLDSEQTWKKADVVIVSLHANRVSIKNNFGFDRDWKNLIGEMPKEQKKILVLFGNPLLLQKNDLPEGIDAVMVGYENNRFVQKAISQVIFGALVPRGELPFTVNEDFKRTNGLNWESSGRLKFSQAEEFGIDSKKFDEIDRIAQNGVAKGAYPGCQIVVALRGKIIYRKSFGSHSHIDKRSVKNDDIYDIASVSKIAGSTLAMMRLQSLGKFSMSKTLKDYIPEIVGDYSHANIGIREMMAHQAGLPAWIPFYKKAMKNGQLDPSIFSDHYSKEYPLEVAKNIWIKKGYPDTIYKQILTAGIGAKSYLYSDLGYYFIKKIIEKQTGKSFDDFLMDECYVPMGLRTLRYQAHKYFPLSRIMPTEDDQVFRKQLVHGFVHDPGAAMLGGIGGHAGLFSNATDLASLMQMFLNKGYYGSLTYLQNEVIQEYTRRQFDGNRRGAGFDRPSPNGGGPCHELASQLSYGHSGFTGTLVWSDPKYGLNYVFLSNRVCPNQENWKIRDMGIRTEIQGVIYRAIQGAKLN